MRCYFVAGERSGDLHGGNLIKALQKYDANYSFRGFGGDHMQAAGLDLYMHYKDMAFMGLIEFFLNLHKILKIFHSCKVDILQYKPNVVVLIDYGGFNRRIAKFCKAHKITVFYYIPPKVWAWRQSRAWSLKQNVDRMFVILPFEKDFFKSKTNWDVDYVGNPVLDAVKEHQADKYFVQKHSLSSKKPLIALLPGSRKQELIRIIPIMAAVVKTNPNYQFVVATVSNVDKDLYTPFNESKNVIFIKETTYDLLKIASAAVVTSGTATLETALFKVPQVVVYKTSAINYFVGMQLIRVPFISLVNLIAGKEVVKELIQKKCNEQNISNQLRELIHNINHRNETVWGYEQIYNMLDIGSASENTAMLMTKYLSTRSNDYELK